MSEQTIGGIWPSIADKLEEDIAAAARANVGHAGQPVSARKKFTVAMLVIAGVVGAYGIGSWIHYHSEAYLFPMVSWYMGKCHPQEKELNIGFTASVLAWSLLNGETADAVEDSLPLHPTPAECAAYKREIAAIRYIDRMGNTRNPAGDLLEKGSYERRRERRLDR